MKYPFTIGAKYRRRDIYKIIGIPEDTRGGNWDTGYSRLDDNWFIFANIGIPGRTGHNYNNEFVGDDLRWRGKTRSHLGQPSIQSMINPVGDIYIFTRIIDSEPFIFSGLGQAKEYRDTVPVEILWTFKATREGRPEVLPEEVLIPEEIFEGATKRISVNIYERNPVERRICIDHYGYSCFVCGLNFEETYGSLGAEYIHVHHLKQLNEIGEEYKIDPINDLRPICPNCHAMIHRRNPPYSIVEVKTHLQMKIR